MYKVSKDELLQLFYEFDFDVLLKEPFLYDGEDELGIYYSLKHPEYGKLYRVYFPKSIDQARDFLQKYRCYINHDDVILMELSDYKSLNPSVSFLYQQHSLTHKDINDIENQMSTPKEDDLYFQKIERTVLILEQVIKDKMKMQKDSHESVLAFAKQYYDLQKELDELMQKYTHEVVEPVESLSEATFYDYSADFSKIQIQDSTLLSLNELQAYQQELVLFLKKLDENDTFIQDKYELLCYPLRIDLIQEEIQEVSKFIAKKKLFSKKQDLFTLLKSIEKKHSLNEIIPYSSYKKNELKRIEEKYRLVSDLDIRTIGDFFVEFDNLQLKEPTISHSKKEILASPKEVILSCEESFNNRSKEEQATLSLYHSVLKPVCSYLEMGQLNIAQDTIKDYMEALKLSSNSMIRARYFKNFSLYDPLDFQQSIIKECNRITNFEPEVLKGDLLVYFKDCKVLCAKKYLETSTKKYLAPSQTFGEDEIIYVALLKKNALVYYIPKEVSFDIDQDDLFIVKNQCSCFLIDLEKNAIKDKKSDIITVVEYRGQKKKEANYVIVSHAKSIKVRQIKKVVIERKDIYE